MSTTEDAEVAADLELIDEVARRTTGEAPAPEAPPTWSAPTARHALEAARPFVPMGTVLPLQTRLRRLKKLLLTLFRPITTHQVQFNEGIFRAVEQLVSNRDRAVSTMQASLATAEVTLSEHAASLAEVEGLRDEVERLRVQVDEARTEAAVLRAKQDRIATAAREALPGGLDEQELTALARDLGDSRDAVYRDLEAAFRGSRAEIRDLVAVYVDEVAALEGGAPVLDVGSGRGEWLEVLRDRGITAYGIDLNAEFVEESTSRGLDVRLGDALAHMRELPDESLSAVTAFHVVEHLALDTLVELVDAALRVLRPGGLVLFETPNPTNITVGAASFYLDPTHLKPLHPQFLQFLAETRGFTSAEIRFVHESEYRALPDLATSDGRIGPDLRRSLEHLNWALFGPLDYALVAHKAGEPAG